MTPKTVTPEVGVECWIMDGEEPIHVRLDWPETGFGGQINWAVSGIERDIYTHATEFWESKRDAQIARYLDAQEKTRQAQAYEAKCLEEIENE